MSLIYFDYLFQLLRNANGKRQQIFPQRTAMRFHFHAHSASASRFHFVFILVFFSTFLIYPVRSFVVYLLALPPTTLSCFVHLFLASCPAIRFCLSLTPSLPLSLSSFDGLSSCLS